MAIRLLSEFAMNELKYISDDEIYGIRISEDLINSVTSICNSFGPKETGGILIGYYAYDQKWANITIATEPTKDSIHGWNTFFRGVLGLKELLDHEWEKNQCFYIGEWHYHPRALPIPSPKDIRQMIRFSKNSKLKCPEPILLIIGGDKYCGWSHSINLIVQNKAQKFHLISD